MSQFRVEMVVDFFGLVLLSLSVCLPDVFLDGRYLRLVNGLFGDLCYYQSSKRCCQAFRGLESMGVLACVCGCVCYFSARVCVRS